MSWCPRTAETPGCSTPPAALTPHASQSAPYFAWDAIIALEWDVSPRGFSVFLFWLSLYFPMVYPTPAPLRSMGVGDAHAAARAPSLPRNHRRAPRTAAGVRSLFARFLTPGEPGGSVWCGVEGCLLRTLKKLGVKSRLCECAKRAHPHGAGAPPRQPSHSTVPRARPCLTSRTKVVQRPFLSEIFSREILKSVEEKSNHQQ